MTAENSVLGGDDSRKRGRGRPKGSKNKGGSGLCAGYDPRRGLGARGDGKPGIDRTRMVELARNATSRAIGALVYILESEEAADRDKIVAATVILDRGWGKPDSSTAQQREEERLALGGSVAALPEDKLRALISFYSAGEGGEGPAMIDGEVVDGDSSS